MDFFANIPIDYNEEYIEDYIKLPYYWVVNFLKGNSVKMKFEEIYKLYSKIEDEDPENILWQLRIEMAKVVCCILWAIYINKHKREQHEVDLCKRNVMNVIGVMCKSHSHLGHLNNDLKSFILAISVFLLVEQQIAEEQIH